VKWFAIFLLMVLLVVFIWFIAAIPSEKLKGKTVNESLISLSENLLYNIKTETPTDSLEQALMKFSVDEMLKGLPNDNARKTFWLNIYNAYYQVLASQNLKPPKIFSEKAIRFADATLSLDDVEHGILRRYRSKYSLGYLPQWFPKKIIKQLAVEKIDFRIHFALNCGAKSCPPIAFYNYENIEAQLELATRSFLESDTEIDEPNKTVNVTKLFRWFQADFGGKKGVRNILSRYKLKYKTYDWSEDLKNFQNTNP